jgi:hypothetical protein
MSHFGHRVIGRTKAAEEAEVAATGADHFGPRVIGDVLAKRRLLARKDEGAKDSRRDPSKRAKKAATQEPKAEAPETPVTTSLDELEAALDGNAEFYEGLYSQELLRPAGPRKGALRLFLKFEMGHEDREDRKAEIEAALK